MTLSLTPPDLDALSAAMEHPCFTVGGRTYNGHLLGYLDFNRYTALLHKIGTDWKATEDDVEKMLRAVLGAMQFNEEAQTALLAAPRPVAQRVLRGFFALHRLEEIETSPVLIPPSE